MDNIVFAALEVVLMLIGRLAVRLLSLGQWRSESLSGQEGRIHAAAGSLSFVRKDQRVITPTGQLFAGIASCIAILAFSAIYVLAP